MIKGERFNSISHLVGAALALAGAVVLVVVASRRGGAYRIVSFSIYGATLFLLYLVSTLYHGLPHGRAKQVFRVLDHQAIYLLIAGSYTPFTLVPLNGVVGWWLFGATWGMALLGLVLDALPLRGARVLPVIIYLVMGWLIVLAIKPLLAVLPGAGFIWPLSGGLLYTSGRAGFARAGGAGNDQPPSPGWPSWPPPRGACSAHCKTPSGFIQHFFAYAQVVLAILYFCTVYRSTAGS